MKAISLFSGGLDSLLATKLIQKQGIEVLGISCLSPFMKDEEKRVIRGAKILNIKIKFIHFGKEYINRVINPKYGYGKNMNPCIDCKILMYREAKRYMQEERADFIFTGEVVGERPMSQRRNILKFMERKAEIEGRILRPLSGKLLPPTSPEVKEIVKRDCLLDFSGRSRVPQIELARVLKIDEYPAPAGGCLLTDPSFSKRIRESISRNEISLKDMQLLSIGRHFRLTSGIKVIVGRNEEENVKLTKMADPLDILFEAKAISSPVVLERNGNEVEIPASLCMRYTKVKEGRVSYKKGSIEKEIDVNAVSEDFIKEYRI